jgi:hypothetical protein
MKAPPFRSVEEWTTALLTLPDKAYFELMRSVFGTIKTPFNKHRLMEDLTSFLARGEIQEIIGAYIDGTDRQILTAIAALGEPGPGELESFFSGDYSYLDLQGILLNLEERLILYRFREEDRYHLALNPLLKPVLAPLITDMSALFPSFEPPNGGPAGDGTAPPPPVDDRILAALTAFVSGEGDFFKAEGGIRKKVLEEGNQLFPGLDTEVLTGGLLEIGLISQTGSRYRRDPGKLRFFQELPPRERLIYWAAGINLYLRGRTEPAPGFNRDQVQTLGRFIHRLLEALSPGRLYPRGTLRRLAGMLGRENAGSIPAFQTAGDLEPLLRSLEMTGLLLPGGQDLLRAVPAVPAAAAPGRPNPPGPVIAMDTAFSCILFPEIRFSDALTLAAFCSVRETGAVVRFELNRESVIRGFDLGMSAQGILSLLDRLSGGRTDQNLRWTLEDWEKRYSGVSLHRGVVLCLAEDRRYLAEGGPEAGPLAPLIARTLAPGVYLLSVSEQDEAARELLKAGVDIIAQPPLAGGNAAGPGPAGGADPYPPLGEGFYRDLPLRSRRFPEPTARGKTPEAERPDAAFFQNRFRLALAKTPLPPQERDELAARIERRLIVSESQLAEGSVRYEKTEARNLDYVGKSAIAKQAIALKSPLEVRWFAPGGELNRAVGIPQGLEKWEGETTLILRPITRETPAALSQEILRISLGKISLLRRIKQSIFGE